MNTAPAKGSGEAGVLENKCNSSDPNHFDVGKLGAVQNKCFHVERNKNNDEEEEKSQTIQEAETNAAEACR